ncbi:MAG TPA: acetyl-CoA carboxylase carboxyltransferase subunit alpha [Planctomycetota bacterium]|nr:acetyl-CoA carboxylase carboxyltransferase subunit alpha [Planctomycetota bacterium]
MASSDPKNGGLDFEAPIAELERKIEELESFAETTEMDLGGQIEQLRARCRELKKEVFANLSAWQRIQIARHPQRPVFTDYHTGIFDDSIELHGDLAFGDDKAIFTGLGTIDGGPLGKKRVMVVGQRKGKNTKDRIAYNFGCAHPEGYRKALKKMQLAEKFKLPIVTFIDTPGAYPGVGAEERGQAHAIARNILEMSRLRVPVVCVVIGEGGSGGALGIGVGDRILMLEHSYYSVISPEGCSSILWKTAEHADKAAEALKLTAKDLLGFGVIDEIVAEPLGGAHRSIPEAIKTVKDRILAALVALEGKKTDDILEERYAKVRRIGIFLEKAETTEEEVAADESGTGEIPVDDAEAAALAEKAEREQAGQGEGAPLTRLAAESKRGR